ncbi:MAG: cytochrome c peroxidase [Saonia sp.]
MKLNQFTLVILFAFVFFSSCKNKPEEKEIAIATNTNMPNWEYAQNFYLEHITASISYLDSLAKVPVDSKKAKEIFTMVRSTFKKAEPYASYLNPEVGHRANGPALPILTDDSQKVLLPIGLQKIEERIYENGTDGERYKKEIQITKGLLINLQQNIRKRELNPQRFFIATHQQLLRIIILSISGFDTPVSHLGFNEAIISLESLREVYNNSIKYIILEKNEVLDTEFQKNINEAINFINSNMGFETFDRYTFIRDYMNPITRNWVAIRKESGLWEGVNHKPFNFDAPTFFEADSFNVEFFTPGINRNPTEEQIALGEKLFFDSNLSENGKMACVTCHNPKKGYADGLVVNLDKNGERLLRNTPTVINAAFQKSFFWDGRSPNLMDQITAVFTNDQEFDSSVHQFSKDILVDSSYVQLFEKAYGGIGARNNEIIRALSSYISTLNAFNSKFDRNIRGEEDTYTEEEKLGFNLYMGKALCATCHFIPLTNGTVPPFFSETEKEVIGVPETAKNKQLDDDLGFYWRFEKELHRGMFKTPTVRNVELTAPYMHNGVYNTLEEVINFYNLGGGGGLGFDLEYQTLPFDNLQLTKEEEKALVAFMKTLTDDKVGVY